KELVQAESKKESTPRDEHLRTSDKELVQAIEKLEKLLAEVKKQADDIKAGADAKNQLAKLEGEQRNLAEQLGDPNNKPSPADAAGKQEEILKGLNEVLKNLPPEGQPQGQDNKPKPPDGKPADGKTEKEKTPPGEKPKPGDPEDFQRRDPK